MKRLLSMILALALMASLVPTVFAASDEAVKAADELYNQGLFNGTGTDENGKPNFDLDRAPTRHEAVTMLVRLLGKSSAAENGTWDTPFTDVDGWAKPYVGYAYANSLTSGTSETTYGGKQTVTASQYLTFVLRALGYQSGTDFQWNKAWELSDKIGLTNGEYNANTTSFTRGDVAIISSRALGCTLKEQSQTLRETLQADDADAPANNFEARVGKNVFESYDEIIGLLEDSEAYAYATVKGYDGQVLFVATETFDDFLGHFATTEATLYTVKANGVTADSIVFSSGSSTPVAIDKDGLICTATHRSVEKSCYGDNGTGTPALMILATVYAGSLDDDYQPQNISGFVRTKNSLVDDDSKEIAADDVETYNKMFDDYYSAQVLGFTRVNGDTPSKAK